MCSSGPPLPGRIPANLAITLHPDFDYVAVAVADEIWILAEGLLENCMRLFGVENFEILRPFALRSLQGLACRHPFLERESVLVLGTHVTLEAGTGCVHTAPGHGREDYDMALEYDLEVYSPIDDDGRFTRDVPFFGGQFVFDANKAVNAKLQEMGRLILEADSRTQLPALLEVQETRSSFGPPSSGSSRWRKTNSATRHWPGSIGWSGFPAGEGAHLQHDPQSPGLVHFSAAFLGSPHHGFHLLGLWETACHTGDF